MSLQIAAQHLASKGRGPDNTLVHMSEGEVKSLQDIAMAHGGSLTINPQTGLPEAGFLSAILPMVAGAALAATGVGAPMAALMVGGGTMLLNRGNLEKGLMAGLSAYGGASLGESLAMEGVKSANAVVPEAVKTAPSTSIMNQPFEAVRGGLPVNEGLSSFNQLPQGAMSPAYVSPSAVQGAPLPPMTVGSSGSAGMNQFIGEFGGASAGAAPAPNAMAGLSPSQVSPAAATPKPPINIAPVTRAPVPVTPLGTPTEPIGMTNAMAKEALSNMTPMERASAMGEGFTGKNLTNYAMANPLPTAAALAGPLLASENQPGVPTAPVDRDPGQQYDYYPGVALPTPSADPYGREKTYYSGSYRPRTTTAADGGMMGWPAGESVIKMADGGMPTYGPGDMGRFATDTATDMLRQRFPHLMGLDANAPVKKYTYDPQIQKYLENDMGTSSEAPRSYNYDAQNQQFTAQVDPTIATTTPMATGGISEAHYNLGGYSDGGRLLRGPGDGVSDSIPATIGRKQPARLADGEFVVPARIVSELGNGSTEAGARKLYAMMDRVQKARRKTVGKDKVAKNSKADKYLPA